MSNAIIAQLVNRQSVAAALRQARTDAAEHKAWMNAINRAALNMESCRWQFDGEVLRIESATNSGTYYIVGADGCPCKAGKENRPCWHRASRRLLIKAAEMAAAPRTVTYKGFRYTPEQQEAARQARIIAGYAEAQAAVDELY